MPIPASSSSEHPRRRHRVCLHPSADRHRLLPTPPPTAGRRPRWRLLPAQPRPQRAFGQGPARGLRDAGIPIDDQLVVTVHWGGREGADAIAKLPSRREPPTAVYAHSGVAALGAVAGLRIPQNVSVIGIDDHPRAELTDLTIVRNPSGSKANCPGACSWTSCAGKRPTVTSSCRPNSSSGAAPRRLAHSPGHSNEGRPPQLSFDRTCHRTGDGDADGNVGDQTHTDSTTGGRVPRGHRLRTGRSLHLKSGRSAVRPRP